MSFLQPLLLFGLPLALLPVVIHLIHQHRHRTVRWAAMQFLLQAKKLTRGMARLRQVLVLAMRVLAVLALVIAAGRPLAGGWVARVAGGAPETVLVLLDRSASMEALASGNGPGSGPGNGASKRETALALVADLLEKTGGRSRVVLLDSAILETAELLSPGDLLDFPSTAATDTAADIPAMLERALDYIQANRTGRTDVWILSDRRTSDWKPASGRWETVRSGFSALEGVRFHLLNFPERAEGNLSVRVERVLRRQAAEGMELLLDLRIRRDRGTGRGSGASEAAGDPADEEGEIPLEITVNGVRTRETVRLAGDELFLQGHAIPLGTGAGAAESGWGRVDLPADRHPGDNSFHFVYGEELPRRTVVLSDDSRSAAAIEAAAASPVDSTGRHEVRVLRTDRQAEIPWEETALLFWQAPLPEAGSAEAVLLRQFVEAGKSLVFLPPEGGGGGEAFHDFHGFRWGEWRDEPTGSGDREREAEPAGDGGESSDISWWRTDSGLLANTRSGDPLPLGELQVFRHRSFSGESEPLLRADSGEELVSRLLLGREGEDRADGTEDGGAYAWGILPRADSSSLAADGIAFFVMVHRALEQGARALSLARSRPAAEGALAGLEGLEALDSPAEGGGLELRGGAFAALAEGGSGGLQGDRRLLALNRPESEDDPRVVDEESLAALFGELDYREFHDETVGGRSLASEIWRSLLVAMALALLAEALLCLPPRPERTAEVKAV